MPDAAFDFQVAQARSWQRIIETASLQADANLELAQKQIGPWKVVAGAFTAGAALVGVMIARAMLAAGHCP